MRKTWVRLALLAACMGLGQQANAQYLPRPVGAARLPEPAPVGAKAPPLNLPLIEGPISPLAAPQGPGPDLSLHEDHSSAFQAVDPGSSVDFQFSIGSLGLARKPLGHSYIAAVENLPRFAFGQVNIPIQAIVTPPGGQVQRFAVPTDVLFQLTGFPDDGRFAARGSPRLGDFNDADTPLGWGVRGGAMLIGESAGLELAGFGVTRQESGFSVVSPVVNVDPAIALQNIANPVVTSPNPPRGFPANTTVVNTGDPTTGVRALFGPSYSLLDLPFRNAPAGFEGNNGLWRQADLVNIGFTSSFAGAEANLHYWSNIGSPIEGMLGVRYFNQHESLGYTTYDDQFMDIVNPNPVMPPSIPVFSATGFPFRRVRDPRVAATYRTEVTNQVLGPQLGIEGHVLPCNWLALSYSAKAVVGVNRVSRDVSLVRGDGLVGFRTHDTLTRFAHAYELGATADISLLEKARLRLGYNFFLLENVATALGQVDYDLSHTHGRQNATDSIFYHGPTIELQFLF